MPVEPLIENVDFAYISTLDFDFGDAPTSYDTLLPYGARHAVGASTNLYLGSIIDIENNGFPASGADGDDLNASDDEDGVAVTSRWTTGSSGGSVQVTVGLGTGYLAGYVDFDQRDNFVGADDLIISQTVSNTGGPSANGVYSFNFDVPETALPDDQSSYFYSRFRLFPSAPLFPALAYSGEAANGEVEDYYWAFHVINGSVFADENDNTNINAGVDRLIPGVVIYLYDSNTNLVGTTVTDLNGKYSFSGLLDDAYRVVMTTPTGATAIADADGGGNSFTNIDVTISGSSAFNRDYLVNSNASLASLSGTVFDDDGFGVAGNGIFDAPDEEVPGVVVALYNDINGNSIADSDEFIGSVPTDGLGAYSFTNLPDANYIVTMQTPGASTNVTDIDGDANSKD